MRLAGHAIAALALALMAVALTPGGDVYQWAAGITLLFAAAGFGSLADNQALKYGGGVRV